MREVIQQSRDAARVYLTPQELMDIKPSQRIEDVLIRKVKAKHEHQCTKDGYVMSIGTSYVRLSDGEAPPEHMNGSFLYNISFNVDVCNPVVNQEIDVVLTSFNRIGLMCQYFPFQNEGGGASAGGGGAVSSGSEDEWGASDGSEGGGSPWHHQPAGGGEEEWEEEEGSEEAASGEEVGPSVVDSRTFARYCKKSSCVVVLVPKALNMTKEESRAAYAQAEEELKVNDTLKLRLRVRILQKKFDINDKQITAVGMLVPAKEEQ